MNTLLHRIAEWAERTPDAPATHDRGVTCTWREHWLAIREVAKGLIAMGLQPQEAVGVVGRNRAEWIVCQFAIMAARAVPAPMYAASTPEQMQYIVRSSKARFAFCEKEPLEVEHALSMELTEVRALGRQQSDEVLDQRLSQITDDEPALLIYTSGTGGEPKGAILNHGGMLALAESLLKRYAVFGEPQTRYRIVSYLPLSHVAEQFFTNVMRIRLGGEVFFCRNISEIRGVLSNARPTVIVGVPRVWEKFQSAVEAQLAGRSRIAQMLTCWARAAELHGRIGRSLGRRLILSKIKYALGLDQVLVAATGAAPIGLRTLEFFASIGLPLHEGYGMSETSGLVSAPWYGRPRLGTVGPVLDGVELRIADDGEIMLKGRALCSGYWLTASSSLWTDGWMHTGDLGSLSGDGYLSITGRKKDLLITAGGENIAPAPIETRLRELPSIAHAVVVGDRRPYLTALLARDPDVKPVDVDLTAINSQLADFQRVRKFAIVDMSIEGGELTPSQKVKRHVVLEKYRAQIDAMYL